MSFFNHNNNKNNYCFNSILYYYLVKSINHIQLYKFMPYNYNSIQMRYILFCVCVQGWGGERGDCYHDI